MNDMSRLTDFYDVKPSAESFEDATVTTMTVEELQAEVSEKEEAFIRDIEDIENGEKAVEQFEELLTIAAPEDESAEALDDNAIKALNIAFASVASMVSYPAEMTPELSAESYANDSKVTVEDFKEKVATAMKNIGAAVMKAIKAVMEMFAKITAWIKTKLGVYKKAFDDIDNGLKKVVKKESDDYTVSSVPATMGVYSIVSGKSAVSNSVLKASFVNDYLNDNIDLADLTTNGVMATKLENVVVDVINDKSAYGYTNAEKAAYNKKAKDELILAVRPNVVTVVAKEQLSSPTSKSVNDYKGADKVIEDATVDGKVKLEVASTDTIKSYASMGKKAIEAYNDKASKVAKKVKEFSKTVDETIKNVDKAVGKYTSTDTKEAAESNKNFFKAVKANIKVAPQATMMYLDTANLGIKMAKGSLKQYKMAEK